MASIWPTEEQLKTLGNFDENQPITMLNLLAYRDTADYSDHPNEVACSGKQAYERYSNAVSPLLEVHGAKIVFMGTASPTIIGPDSEQWDDVLLVEYPTPKAFVAMATSEAYRALSHHRSAALRDSRLVPISAGRLAFQSTQA
ncbi:MAG: hypothetical protein ACI9BW_001418 [Gammaproteobacteria bacterium]|jgi:uncharacterized protein (DUF1330 family)